MARASIPDPDLADWVDLQGCLRRDTGRPPAEVRHRDRAIGERLAHLDGRPALKLAAWVREVEAGTAASGRASATGSPGASAAEAVRLAALLLAAVGFVFGAAAAVGAFSFQPRGRINVVTVLGVLVALPNLFFLFALVGALPERVRRRLPLPGGDTGGGALLQPARIALRAVPQDARETLEQALGTTGALAKLSAPLRRWLLLRTSQAAALAFATGALAAALAQVVFTDLSFGWSTTLEVDVDRVYDVARLIAAPWAWLAPEAAPTRALVESTRFFRIAPNPGSAVAVYGRWWPFVVACVFVYGWLPRALFLLVARSRFRAAVRRALVDAPGSRRVLARLESPLVESASPDDTCTEQDEAPRGSALADSALPERAVLVSWGDALGLLPAEQAAAVAVRRYDVGGQRTPEDDAQTLRDAARDAKEQDVPVVVAVRGYEPPLSEQIDFLAELRAELGDAHPIVVAGIAPGEERLGAWRRRLATLADPWLAVARVETGDEAL